MTERTGSRVQRKLEGREIKQKNWVDLKIQRNENPELEILLFVSLKTEFIVINLLNT